MVFAEADHIINMPQLKGHGGASVTLGLKNHFGSVGLTKDARGSHDAHDSHGSYVGFYGYSYDDAAGLAGNPANLLADINANPVFKDKTRLILGDGLMGNPTINWQDPVVWKTFGDQPPEILFFGVDPVAVDSVMFDYLQSECAAAGEAARDDDILHYAAAIGLGTHEHWNDAADKKYTAIDYRSIER